MINFDFDKTFQKRVLSWGVHSLLTHEKLQNAEKNLLPDDVLTIHCSIAIRNKKSVVTSGTSKHLLSSGMLDQTNTAKSLENMMGEVFLNGKFSDCTVFCQGREFNCHKMILAGRSPVFNATFTHDMEENRSGRIVINDLDVDTVGKMLAYIYSGKIANTDGKEGTLLAAADKYDLSGLKSMCEDALSKAMHIDNVLDMLLLADLHKAGRVKALALNFTIENAQEIVSQEGWSKKLEKFPSILSEMFKAAAKK